MRLGGMEIIIIIAIVLILFGSKLIPKLFNMGKNSAKTLKDEMKKAEEELREDTEEAEEAETNE